MSWSWLPPIANGLVGVGGVVVGAFITGGSTRRREHRARLEELQLRLYWDDRDNMIALQDAIAEFGNACSELVRDQPDGDQAEYRIHCDEVRDGHRQRVYRLMTRCRDDEVGGTVAAFLNVEASFWRLLPHAVPQSGLWIINETAHHVDTAIGKWLALDPAELIDPRLRKRRLREQELHPETDERRWRILFRAFGRPTRKQWRAMGTRSGDDFVKHQRRRPDRGGSSDTGIDPAS